VLCCREEAVQKNTGPVELAVVRIDEDDDEDEDEDEVFVPLTDE